MKTTTFTDKNSIVNPAKSGNDIEFKTLTISEGLTYMTHKSFKFSLDDDKDRQFGVIFEILDMHEATGDDKFEQYPFVVSASIIADKPHRSFAETESRKKADLIYDANSYMGGVPVDHYLAQSVQRGDEESELSAWENITKHFSIGEAMVVTEAVNYGTVAAQRGPGTEHSYLQFKNEEAAQKYVDLLVNRMSILSVMIGFILDAPINMMGDSGWSVIESMVYGTSRHYNRR